MQEQNDFPIFPDTKSAVDREIYSDDDRFPDLGRLRLSVYRVGFQVVRELRNQFEPWLRYYKAKVDTADGTTITQFAFRIINGSFIEDFNEDFQMSEHGAQELEEIGALVFERNGMLREKWRSGVNAGTRVFGPELSASATKIAVLACVDKDPRGDFLMVHEQSRRRGVGSWVLQTLFRLLREEGVIFVLTRPTAPRVLPNLQGSATEGGLLRRNLAFIRKNGFRRLGLSPVFAYMLADGNHPSRQLAAERDADP